MVLAVQGTLPGHAHPEGAIDLLEHQGPRGGPAASGLPTDAQCQWDRPSAGVDHHAGDWAHRARFAQVRDYASDYRCIGSERLSDSKREDRGNTKNDRLAAAAADISWWRIGDAQTMVCCTPPGRRTIRN